MWRITAEGRRFLQALAARCGDRATFGELVGIGKNQVKPLLDTPDHAISQNTCEKLRAFEPGFVQGVHFIHQAGANDCEVRLARDRSTTKTLSRHDQRGIERLYDALLRNPDFQPLRPSYDSLAEFRQIIRVWGSASEDQPAEQFFVHRVYQDTVISFLFGERHFRTPATPLELFAIWYLVGPVNAFYEGSPVGLDIEAEKELPVGERQSATSLTIRLLEELHQERSIDYLFFEVGAQELAKPNSLARLLFRVYARAEDEVRQHFAHDAILKQCQFYVLDFPFLVPRWNEEAQTVELHEHRLVCCPMKPQLSKPFQTGILPQTTVVALLDAIYPMFWDFYDFDAPSRHAIQQAGREAVRRFEADSTEGIACYSLRDYVATHFLGNNAAKTGHGGPKLAV